MRRTGGQKVVPEDTGAFVISAMYNQRIRI